MRAVAWHVVPGQSNARLALLVSAVALESTAIGVLFPLLARVQAADHLPTYGLGLMSGGAFFAALGAQLGVGPFLDGRRGRLVLLAGLAAAVAGLVWFAWASSLSQLVGARVLGGLGYGIVTPAALRAASVGVTGQERGQRLGIISSASMTGIVVGPLAGSTLAAVGGLRLPFLVVAGMLAAVLLVAALWPAAVPAAGHPRSVHGVAGLSTAAASAAAPAGALGVAPAATATATATAAAADTASGRGGARLAGVSAASLAALLMLGAAMQLPTGLYDSLWSRLLTDRGAGELLIGLSLSLFGLPYVLLAPFGGRLAERRGPLLAAAAALIVSDGFMASYGFVPSPIVITVLGVAEACVQAVAVPGGFAAVARVFPEWRAATGQSWFGGAGTATAGAAALVGAPMYAVAGPGLVFAGGATISVLLGAGALLAGRRGPAARAGATGKRSTVGAAPGAGSPAAVTGAA